MSPPPEHHHDRPVFAAALMMLGVLAGTGIDNIAKWVLTDHPLSQFVFLRSVGATAFMLVVALATRRRVWVTRRLGWHLARTLLLAVTMFGFFYGIKYLPLVDVVTLGFSAPIMIALLAIPLLGEVLGWRRWLAVLAGFGGVIVVLRPGITLLQPAALIVLVSALTYALLAISSRHLGRTESTLTMAFYLLLGPLLLSAPLAAAEWVTPTRAILLVNLFAGLLAGAGWLAAMEAFRLASPTVLAPLEYTALVFNAGTGYFIWNEAPGAMTAVGAVLITASGLYIVYREYQIQRRNRAVVTAVLDAERETPIVPGV